MKFKSFPVFFAFIVLFDRDVSRQGTKIHMEIERMHILKKKEEKMGLDLAACVENEPSFSLQIFSSSILFCIFYLFLFAFRG